MGGAKANAADGGGGATATTVTNVTTAAAASAKTLREKFTCTAADDAGGI